jgi:hypothetical protein
MDKQYFFKARPPPLRQREKTGIANSYRRVSDKPIATTLRKFWGEANLAWPNENRTLEKRRGVPQHTQGSLKFNTEVTMAVLVPIIFIGLAALIAMVVYLDYYVNREEKKD